MGSLSGDRLRRSLLLSGALALLVLVLVVDLAGGPTWATAFAAVLAALLVGIEIFGGRRTTGAGRGEVISGPYGFVAEQAPVIAYLAETGENARWHYVSPHIETLLGFTAQEWCHNPALWRRQIHPDDLPLAISDEGRALTSGEPNATDYRIRTKDGEEIWVRDIAVAVTGEDDTVTQGVIYDITSLKRAEEGLRTRERMLRGALRERTRELERSRLEMLQRLAIAAEMHDEGTRDHTVRVGRIAAAIARSMGLSPGFVELLAQAAPLHDIGKLGVHRDILVQRATLTDLEADEIRAHTIAGARILAGSETPALRLAEQIALTHHERWDGRGYPRGLTGEEIPVAGRITMVADVFDALMHDRAYKRAWSVEEALAEVRASAGTRFDPAVVDAFMRLDHELLLAATERGRTGSPRAA